MHDGSPGRWLLCAGCSALVWASAWAQARGVASQSKIAQEVRHELVTLPYYTVFDSLTFTLKGNTIILSGQVNRSTLKSDAEEAVKQIEGVQRVDNQIEVLPISESDQRIRLAVYVATYGQPILSQYALQAVAPVHIIVKNANVTWEGSVGTQLDKTTFVTSASGVPGISSVTDRLQIALSIPTQDLGIKRPSRSR